MAVRDDGGFRGLRGFRRFRGFGFLGGLRGFVRGINGFNTRPLACPRARPRARPRAARGQGRGRGHGFAARKIKDHVDGVLGFIAVFVGVHGCKNWVRNSCFGGKGRHNEVLGHCGCVCNPRPKPPRYYIVMT